MSLLGVTRREITALIVNPYAYVVAAAYFVISGIFFAAIFLSTTLPDLERYFSNIGATLVVLVPLIAVRSFADERRTGVLDLQLSWPVARWKLAVGKYLANTIFLIVLISIMWVYVRQLAALSEIEIGKSVAEYVGLVLLVVAFSGIAHAITSRATTTPGAAFLGFGVLLGLWVLDFVPGWLGNATVAGFRLTSIAPSLRLEPFGRGVIPLGEVLFFVGVAMGGVGLTILAIGEHRLRLSRSADAGWVRASVSVALAVGLTAPVLWASERASLQWDLTPTTRFTVSQLTSAEVLPDLPEPPTVTAFIERGSAMEVQIRSLIRSYEAVGAQIDEQFIDPDIQPSLAKRHDIQRYGQALIEMNGRTERVESLTEVSLTSALVRLMHDDPQTACFTTGHGERNPDEGRLRGYGQYAAELRVSGFEIDTIALAAPGGDEEIAKCDLLILAGPRVLFLDEEVQLLEQFLDRNGRMIVFGAESPDVRRQLNDILRPYGLAFGEGIVLDNSSLVDDEGAVVVFDYPSQSPATSFVKAHEIPTVFSGSLPIAIDSAAAGAGHVAPLARSSTESLTDAGGTGPFDLAALSDRGEVVGTIDEPSIDRTRIAAVGTADVAANEFFSTLGNRDLTLRLTQWVVRQDDLIAAAAPPGGVREVPVTDGQRQDLILRSIVLPGLAPLPLAAVAARRRRRG